MKLVNVSIVIRLWSFFDHKKCCADCLYQ